MANRFKIGLVAIPIAVVLVFALSSFAALSKPSPKGTSDLYSNNWSGYLATSDLSFSSISSSWIVPSVTKSASAEGYSSIWIGIGGVVGSNNRLIQTGTEQDVLSDGSKVYYGWFEVYPRPPVNLGKISPGDLITANISKRQESAITWHVSLTKSSNGISSPLFNGDVQVRTNAAVRSSVEFIVEAPSAVSGRQSELLPLANFQTIVFSKCNTDLGGLMALPGVYRMSITSDGTSTGKIISTPGPLSGDSFTVSRQT